MSKCLAVKTTENTLEKTAGANNVTTLVKLAVLEKQANQNFAPNDEIWITESGNFTVPFTGEYEVTVIGGGSGLTIITYSGANDCPTLIASGQSADRVTRRVYLEKDQVVPVVIGAGVPNVTYKAGNIGAYPQPTVSSFGDIRTYRYWEYDALSEEEKRTRPYGGCIGGYAQGTPGAPPDHSSYVIYVTPPGQGSGSGYPDALVGTARGYGGGAGGGVEVYKNASGVWYVGNSGYGTAKQGCVILRFFNPEKASLLTINETDLIPYTELLKKIAQMEVRLNLLENNGS